MGRLRTEVMGCWSVTTEGSSRSKVEVAEEGWTGVFCSQLGRREGWKSSEAP